MANQQNSYTGSQGTGTNNADFSFTFPSFTTSEVKVEVDNVVKTLTAHYTVEEYNTTSGGKVRFTTNNIPTGTTPVRIFRQTDVDTAKATFTAGSSLKAGEINDNFKQIRHALQEAIGAVATDRKVQRFNIEADTIDGTLIADDVVDSEHLVAGSIDLEHMSANSVDSDQYVDGSIDLVHMSANSVDSDQYVDGSIDLIHMSPNSVDSDQYVDGSIDLVHMSPNSVDSDQYVDGSIDLIHMSPNSVDSDQYVDGSIDHVHLSGDCVDADNIQDNAVGSEHIQTNAVTDSEIATGTLDNRYFTETELTSGALDGRYFTETESDARYFNVSTGDTIKDGDTFPDNDTTIATTAAINDRIIDLVDDVGGFVPIANETSFPTSNPDVNDGAGTIVSVSAASTNLVPSGTTVTIANGRGSGLPVVITGVSATIPSGFGFLVETTTTDHTYAFHRLSPKATEVTTVAGKATEVTTVHTNITNINAVAADISDINAVAADATDIGAVAAKATEIGRLGTADAVADMAILGTADVVSDLNTLGTADVVADMNMLATSDVVADMNMLAVSDVISDMNDLATSGNITAMSTCSTNIASINNCSTNISSANTFGDQYQVASNNPSTDGGGNALAAGDLYFNTSANELKVYNGSSWQGGVTATGSFAAITGNTFTGDNRYNDGVKALFGTGSDLEIFHDGSTSRIVSDAHALMLNTTTFVLKNAGFNEDMITAASDGAVSLYYDGNKKFETTSTGIDVTGRIFGDTISLGGTGTTYDALFQFSNNTAYSATGTNAEVAIGNANSSAATNSTGIHMFTDGNGRGIVNLNACNNSTNASADFVVQTRHNSTLGERLRITSDGNIKIPDNAKLQIGASQDLSLYHNGTNNSSFIDNITGDLTIRGGGGDIIINPVNTETAIYAIANGKVQLRYDNSTKFETTSTGVTVTGNVNIATGNNVTTGSVVTTSSTALTAVDNGIAYFGTDLDLRIYHNGSDSFVRDQGTGGLYLTGSAVGIRNSAANEDALVFAENAAVQLFFDNVKKFETTSDGVTSNEKLKVEGDHILIDNDGDSMYRLSKNGTAVFSIRNNSTGGCHLNTQNDAILAFGVASGSSPGTVNSDLRIVAGGNTQISADNKKLQIGAGQDLELSHDGSSSYITNSTGFLFVQSNDLALRSQGQENFITAAANGSVELYYDNVKKFETTSSGVNIPDNAKLGLGSHPSAGGDLLIWHNGSDNFIDTRWNLTIRKDDGAETLAKFNNNAGVQLYYDNSNMLETINGGARVNGVLHVTSHLDMTDSGIIKLGDGDDLQLKHSGTDSIITHETGSGLLRINAAAGGEIHITKSGPETLAKFIPDGAVELYYDNVKRCETYSSGLEIVAGQQLRFPHANASDGNDGTISSGVHGEGLVLVGCRTASGGQREILHYGRIRPAVNNAESIGAVGQAYGQVHSIRLYMRYDSNSTGLYIGVDDDIRGYHDGTNSYFTNKTGNFYIGNTHSSGNVIFRSNNTDRWHIDGNGHFLPDANNTYDIGTTSNRVRNIYTNDLHLSNEGSSNDVDGTWGDWTIQEGESDLFLKNNRSGKKYKFNLTEVS